MTPLRSKLTAVLVFPLLSLTAVAWDYDGHRMINLAALAALPPDFPSFVRKPAAVERIAFLSGEPDRWRNTPDLPLKHCANPDHYFDYEYIAEAGLKMQSISDLRNVFMAEFAKGRAANAGNFAPIDPAKNAEHTAEWPGFAPWAITEYYGKLKSGFSYLKAYQELGTAEEVANAEASIIYIMGVMGHFVGDCAQPLHLTKHHNGWVGKNPEEFTRWPGFHAWIDGGFARACGITTEDLLPSVTPAKAWPSEPAAGGRDPMFAAVIDYIATEHEFMVPLYQLEKDGHLKKEVAETSGVGRKFLEDRLLAGSQALASIWITAWKSAGPDGYLRARLKERNKQAEETPEES